ncbi:MAG: 3'-5' exonuclease [Lentisphaerae bacterium]|nr:3'-5' exonuclease [Lentisphaerota bacterium]MBT4814630.1 3'-5' exonuclease [Lentisphaerota bacterium]MBT5605460.1 3'-5' exonuclease [Lentisphaerota bacterium]MBT7060109.1 3'-5' exonuclease [Lentisphaerota bacterium]MBT7840831.1 3'-5' exonuclease [Lentisphaerota bacterium]
MLLELSRPLVVFDLETTGTNPHVDRIVEIALLKVFPDGQTESRCLLINPEQPIPPETTAIHGITDDDVAKAPQFRQVSVELLTFLHDCDLAGFAIIRFDVPLLRREFSRAGIDFPPPNTRLVDAQRIFHLNEPRNLAAALRFYCDDDHANAHSADADVAATWRVLLGQLERYEDLPRGVDELDAFCNPRDPGALDAEGKIKWRGKDAVIAFGQKSGMSLKRLAQDEPNYLKWILNKDFSPEVKAIVRDAMAGRFPTRPETA